ncbi:DUF2235 domain-containing protein [Sphingomonas sp. CFBP 8760]|uniref:DUF2235 domain-containing protein n=1 Tax=Sphingomonas sp. CFBP 8760 TaxID=2775282 RepID=UPI001786B0E0|nr:DUF2235 domain-containing protein [Sphingomonas sp. CFBP 8760]MBD8548280.1 DUF2235 domain-containing protein [Sphingomonas sp. CFBP 8760]
MTTTTAPAYDPAEADGVVRPSRRHIILFSDGTGNSSGKVFKTNVWRMYEALDLGPAAPDREQQIAFYDDGVGTSLFKPLAVLGGVFGFGLKRNILEIYRFACRNYRPGASSEEGDRIYGFGFSRGAFTIRLVIALIASQGLVVSRNEAELRRLSEDAYRCFRRDFKPRRLEWPTVAFRKAREWMIGGWRKWRRIPLYDTVERHEPDIGFVGVWDTVAAYGGPITEVVRAIDNWFYALSMPDYRLSTKVYRAAHALAIDDERDAFHPLVLDEVHENDEAARGSIEKGRLKQVWFAGMHADVGGGYPDESLSYVSLLWMIDEAHACGLRTLETITARYRALANSAGPIHDSRSGLGGYYRYQPRKIAAWMTTPDAGSLYQRDPANTDENGDPRGYLPEVLIHASVAARIADGTDRYAPLTLPSRFRIAPLERGGETSPQPDSVTPGTPASPSGSGAPMISAELRKRFENLRRGEQRVAAMEAVWDLVWYRRIAYFATLASTLALVMLPVWVDLAPDPPVLADGRTWFGEIVRGTGLFLPAFVEGWIDAAAANSFYLLLTGILVVGCLRVGSVLEARLRDRTRAIWSDALLRDREEDGLPDPVEPPDPRLRTSPVYQRFVSWMKWSLLPGVLGAAMSAILFWLVVGLVTQVRLPALERGGSLCPSHAGGNRELTRVDVVFDTGSLCAPVGRSVRRGHRYFLTLDTKVSWEDGGRPATPAGIKAGDLPFPIGYLGVPLRRVVNAGFLQPAYLIRSPRRWWQWREPIFIEPLRFTWDPSRSVWHASFEARRDGELSLFANDAIPPVGPLDYFYEGGLGNNTGQARITIAAAPKGS